jgi:hypothetical protein
MIRSLLGLAVALGIAALPTIADEPKKKERIAINEPEKLKDDADFATQGEYVGESPDKTKIGIQVIAKGQGQFDLKMHMGGLPGDGWDGKATHKETAALKDGKVICSKGHAVIGDGIITVTDGDTKFVLKKVERKSKTLGAKPPEGAVVLFAKEGDEANWNGGNLVKLSDGTFLGVGVTSKQAFGAFKAHIEFRLPWMPNSTGQGRGNSGVYFQNRYECQVLDSFGLNGENNECGGIYTQHKPKVNMCYPPMAWQTYDIDFTPAQFDGDGKKAKNGRATVKHNGVVIHDDIEFPKECPGGQKESAAPGPFQFQNHGDPVVYRNVWVVEVK